MRQVFVKDAPALNSVPSGTVMSATNSARSTLAGNGVAVLTVVLDGVKVTVGVLVGLEVSVAEAVNVDEAGLDTEAVRLGVEVAEAVAVWVGLEVEVKVGVFVPVSVAVGEGGSVGEVVRAGRGVSSGSAAKRIDSGLANTTMDAPMTTEARATPMMSRVANEIWGACDKVGPRFETLSPYQVQRR